MTNINTMIKSTDGSKNENAVSSAYVPLSPKIYVQGQRIPSEATIFTAEANSINIAIAINDLNKSKNNQFVIFTLTIMLNSS